MMKKIYIFLCFQGLPIQLSFKKLIHLPLRINHCSRDSRIGLIFIKEDQIEKTFFNLRRLCGSWKYLIIRFLAQSISFSWIRHQPKLTRSTWFLDFALGIPRPPLTLGHVTISHLTRLPCLTCSLSPQRKFLLMRSS